LLNNTEKDFITKGNGEDVDTARSQRRKIAVSVTSSYRLEEGKDTTGGDIKEETRVRLRFSGGEKKEELQ